MGSGKKGQGFEDSVHSLGSCVVVVIAAAVVVGGILAYAFSEQFREGVTLGQFLLGVAAWCAIAFVILWMRRQVRKG